MITLLENSSTSYVRDSRIYVILHISTYLITSLIIDFVLLTAPSVHIAITYLNLFIERFESLVLPVSGAALACELFINMHATKLQLELRRRARQPAQMRSQYIENLLIRLKYSYLTLLHNISNV